MKTEKKNVLLLALCQAALMTGQALMLSAAPLVGVLLAVDKSLATLPISVQVASTLLTVMPAAFLMKRIGRRAGFLIGTVVGIVGSGLAAYGIAQGDFVLFCAGLGLNGVFVGFGTYYRFAAADAASADYRGRAISYVLAGGVIAAVVGPNLARFTADVLHAQFAGSYLSVVGVYTIALIALLFVNLAPPSEEERLGQGRPLGVIMRQPAFIVAVIGAMFGFGVMNLVMISTPLTMHEHHYPFADTASIIQWHMLGMFAPSFFTGHLIKRFGVLRIMHAGVLLCVLCVGFNLASTDYAAIFVALVALGIGWNFLFVGGTTLLTETYAPEEKAKTQAINDFLVLGTTTITSFSSGPLHHHYGWAAVNLSVLPLLLTVALGLLWLQRQRRVSIAN